MDDSRKLLEELELTLLRPAGRSDKAVLAKLISDEFTEVGASGATFGKHDVLAALPTEADVTFHVAHLQVKLLSSTVGLVTYVVTKRSGAQSVASKRCSIWQLTQDQWQLVYHQGTPT